MRGVYRKTTSNVAVEILLVNAVNRTSCGPAHLRMFEVKHEFVCFKNSLLCLDSFSKVD